QRVARRSVQTRWSYRPSRRIDLPRYRTPRCRKLFRLERGQRDGRRENLDGRYRGIRIATDHLVAFVRSLRTRPVGRVRAPQLQGAEIRSRTSVAVVQIRQDPSFVEGKRSSSQ